jgi:hypothetical protein
VYEAILRIGACLRETVERSGVKTISDNIVWHVIKQIHNVCGLDFNHMEKSMLERLNKFSAWRVNRKEERKKRRESGVSSKSSDETNEDEDEDEEAEVEEVEEVEEAEEVEDANEEDVEVEVEEDAE